MKIVKSKLSIAVLSVGFVGAVAAISFAALNRTPKFEPKPKISDKVAVKELAEPVKEAPKKLAPHQDEVENYLESMKGFLQTPPRDGVFGGDRIPTLHDKDTDDLPAFKTMKTLEGQIQLRSAVVGLYSAKNMEERKKQVDDDGHKIGTGKYDQVRLTDVHLLAPNRGEDDAASVQWDLGTNTLRKFALTAMAKGQDSYVEPVQFDGKNAWIVAKAVHASVNSCYKCHTDIKKGEPIGYTVALLSNLKPGEKSKLQKNDDI